MTRLPAVFIALPVLAFLPFDLLNEFLSSAFGAGGTFAEMRAYHRVAQLIELGVGSLVAATVLQATVAVGEGRAPTTLQALKEGVAAWGRAIKTTFVSGVFIGVASIFLLVPGLVLATRYMLAVPASVIDGLDSTAARAKSTALVKERGAVRLFLWGIAAVFSWYVLAMLPTMTMSLLMPTVPFAVEASINAVFTSIWNVVGTGFVVAVGLLYLEINGRSLQWPAGLSLRTSEGQRIVGPQSSGQVLLAAVAVCAGLAAVVLVPVMSLLVWLIVDAEGARAFIDQSPFVSDFIQTVFGET